MSQVSYHFEGAEHVIFNASKTDIKNLPYEKLKNYLISKGENPFHAVQIMKWLFQKDALSFDDMTDLSLDLRQKLKEKYEIQSLRMAQRQHSQDGTQKFLFELKDRSTVESVYMKTKGRITLCVSTQVGCRMGCKFCLTAKQGWIRNLTPCEIVDQVSEVQKSTKTRITHVVMMGMGEPLDNYENVLDALDILKSKWAFHISQRKITVSTVGLVPRITQFGKDSDVNLAISLNAPNDEIRNKIMPMNKKYSMEAVLETARKFPLKLNRRITFEYVLLGGINDSLLHAKELIKKIKGIKCKMNLIPFNAFPKGAFKRPSDAAVGAFQKVLIDAHISAFVRKSRGRDILAACGQLCSEGYKT